MGCSKWKQYRAGCDEAARKVAAPVLDWLAERDPNKLYGAHFSSTHFPDGPRIYHSNVCQIGPGWFRRIFPKRIACVQDWGHDSEYALRSYDQRTLPPEELDRLMAGISVQDIRTVWENKIPSRPKGIIERLGDWLEMDYERTSSHES